jgi:hypothetical protein
MILWSRTGSEGGQMGYLLGVEAEGVLAVARGLSGDYVVKGV